MASRTSGLSDDLSATSDLNEAAQEDKKTVQLRFHVDGYKEIRKEIHYEYTLMANILRIWDWKRIQRMILKNVECLIPRFPRDSLPGFGLLPPVGLPMLFFSLWGYILFPRINWFLESRILLAVLFAQTAVISVWSSAFFFYCMDEDTSARIFKRPINIIKEYRTVFFGVTIVLFFTLIFYAVLKK